MLSNFFKALGNFFSSIFGSKPKGGSKSNSNKTKPTTTTTKPGTNPTRPSRPSRPSTGTKPAPASVSPPEPEEPQDAAELEPDSIIIVAHEMEEVILLPNEEDEDFDENIFDETAEEVDEPLPEPEPAHEIPPTPTGRQPRYLWCLDNGHGKKSAGKRSPVFDDGTTQFFEYEFNRDIVARIIVGLEKEGIQYFNVVPEVDIDNFLQGRVNRANRKSSKLPKLYLSIHSNAGPSQANSPWTASNTKGIETWYYHGSKKGQKLAAAFQKHLLAETGFNNRHLKSRPDRQFYVLRKTAMTSVLTENGFFNNKKEALELMKPSVRQKIADAHIKAIIEIEENGL